VTTYSVSWGYDPHMTRSVQSAEELDAVLDEAVEAQDEDGLHYVIDIVDPDTKHGEFDLPLGLHMGVGPKRAKVFWTGPGENIGYEPGVPPVTTDLPEFNYGGLPTEESPETVRVTPAVAREAAREFVTTGQRPTCLEWTAE